MMMMMMMTTRTADSDEDGDGDDDEGGRALLFSGLGPNFNTIVVILGISFH